MRIAEERIPATNTTVTLSHRDRAENAELQMIAHTIFFDMDAFENAQQLIDSVDNVENHAVCTFQWKF